MWVKYYLSEVVCGNVSGRSPGVLSLKFNINKFFNAKLLQLSTHVSYWEWSTSPGGTVYAQFQVSASFSPY